MDSEDLQPPPPDFREKFVEMGWSDIENHYKVHAKTIRRWIDEEGREALIAARSAHVEERRRQHRAERRRLMTVERQRRYGGG
ncbi:MAG: hypothetical protein GC201_01075 [Alphaproteobacteria bacterium]|nr:hypothetical protein [Alphaproteobacteria bacterium]